MATREVVWEKISQFEEVPLFIKKKISSLLDYNSFVDFFRAEVWFFCGSIADVSWCILLVLFKVEDPSEPPCWENTFPGRIPLVIERYETKGKCFDFVGFFGTPLDADRFEAFVKVCFLLRFNCFVLICYLIAFFA